jgi:hypothetical protein
MQYASKDFWIHQADFIKEINYPSEHSDDRFSVVIFNVKKINNHQMATRDMNLGPTTNWIILNVNGLQITTLQVHEKLMKNPFLHCQLYYITRVDWEIM